MKKIFLVLSLFLLSACMHAQNPNTDLPIETPKTTPLTEVDYNQDPVSYYMESVEDIMEEYIPMMNTMVKLTVYQGDAESLYNEAYDIMSKYHKLLDSHHIYRDEEDNIVQNIKLINDSYGTGAALPVTDEMIEALEEAINMSKLSHGYFNPFMGSLIDLWSPKFSAFPIENTDPSDEEINKAKACVPSIEQFDEILFIDKENKTITFHQLEGCTGSVSINLGAFSKGYIVDKVDEKLSSYDAVWLLDAGTSTVTGHDPQGQKTWNAGARSPYNKAAYMYVLQLRNNDSFSTSGDDNSYFILNNGDDTTTIRCHILNPFTGVSESTYRSASVLTQNHAAVTDVLSTVMFTVSDKNEAFEIINAFEEAYDTEISVSWVRETDSEFKLAAIETTQAIYERILEETVMDSVENIILMEEPK